MKVLVLGGAGYVGSILCPMLVEAGHDVTVLDNFLYGQHTLAQLQHLPHFAMYRADVRDYAQIRPYVKAADIVMPLAALVGAPLCDRNPVDAELTNLKHPLELFANLSHDQICIMPTTESVYGTNSEICTEESPINPLSSYGKHKAAVEQALLEREHSCSLRLATVFGMSPRMRLDLLVNDFTWKAYKEGSILLFEHHFRRTMLHVRDAGRAYLHAIDNNLRGIYNVGDVNLTKLSLCDAIKRKLPKFYYTLMPLGTDADQRNYEVSSAKLKATGFTFTMDLDAGLDELLKGYRTLSNTVHGNV